MTNVGLRESWKSGLPIVCTQSHESGSGSAHLLLFSAPLFWSSVTSLAVVRETSPSQLVPYGEHSTCTTCLGHGFLEDTHLVSLLVLVNVRGLFQVFLLHLRVVDLVARQWVIRQ